MTKRTSTLEELSARYFEEDDARLEKYDRNHRAACLHSDKFTRCKCEDRYYARRLKTGAMFRRIFYHLHEHLYPQNKIYTVRNGMVVATRDKP